MALDVRPVSSRRDLRQFIELPYRLHSSREQWVPPLRIERRMFLDPRFNAFFKNGEAQLFLARRDGRLVGRVSAQVDHTFNRYHRNRWGMFGFLEVEDDEEAFAALIEAAEGWLRSRGRDHMIGPMDFTLNDESGVLIEGFDREPFVKQPWHPRYYQRLCEDYGLRKAVDLWMWELYIEDRSKIVPEIFEMAAKLEPEHGIRVRKMSRWKLRKELDLFGQTYNEAWQDNWGFVPYTPETLDHYAQELQIVFDKHWFMVAEKIDSGESVGVAITVPDINQVLKRMRGRVLPFGWWHYLRRAQIMDRVRVGFLGVKPQYQHTGVAAAFYVEHFDTAIERPQKWGEMGWILETNDAMNRGMEGMGGRVVKRYRVYERALQGG